MDTFWQLILKVYAFLLSNKIHFYPAMKLRLYSRRLKIIAILLVIHTDKLHSITLSNYHSLYLGSVHSQLRNAQPLLSGKYVFFKLHAQLMGPRM